VVGRDDWEIVVVGGDDGATVVGRIVVVVPNLLLVSVDKLARSPYLRQFVVRQGGRIAHVKFDVKMT
jgi:hypothetical protein